MGSFITDEDVYEVSRDYLLFRWHWFSELTTYEKMWNIILLPLGYALTLVVFLIFLFVWKIPHGRR